MSIEQRLTRLERGRTADIADDMAMLTAWLDSHKTHADIWRLLRSGWLTDDALAAFMRGAPVAAHPRLIEFLMGRLTERELRAIVALDVPTTSPHNV